MFNHEEVVKGVSSCEKVWKYYENVSMWSKWDQGMKNVTLEGDFANGSKGVMYLDNDQVPPLPFVLADVVENKEFTAIAQLGDIQVIHKHILNKIDNEVEIKHVVVVEGQPEQAIMGIGKGLTNGLKESMEALLSLSQKD